MGASLQWAIQAQPAGREQLAPTNIHFPCVLTTPEPPDLLTRLLSSWSSVSWKPVLSGALDRFLHSHSSGRRLGVDVRKPMAPLHIVCGCRFTQRSGSLGGSGQEHGDPGEVPASHPLPTSAATASTACWEMERCRRALCGRPWLSPASTSWTTSSPFLTSTAWARVTLPRCSTSWTSTRSVARPSGMYGAVA